MQTVPPLKAHALKRRSELNGLIGRYHWMFDSYTELAEPKKILDIDTRELYTMRLEGLTLKNNFGSISGGVKYKNYDDVPGLRQYSFTFKHNGTVIKICEDGNKKTPRADSEYGFHYDYDRSKDSPDHPLYHFSHNYLIAPRFRGEQLIETVAFERLLTVLYDAFYSRPKDKTKSAPKHTFMTDYR